VLRDRRILLRVVDIGSSSGEEDAIEVYLFAYTRFSVNDERSRATLSFPYLHYYQAKVLQSRISMDASSPYLLSGNIPVGAIAPTAPDEVEVHDLIYAEPCTQNILCSCLCA
jgi:hypothetical protein